MGELLGFVFVTKPTMHMSNTVKFTANEVGNFFTSQSFHKAYCLSRNKDSVLSSKFGSGTAFSKHLDEFAIFPGTLYDGWITIQKVLDLLFSIYFDLEIQLFP
jgi:hypothetical protein